ncbi:hypothetical protein THOM_1362 [Trachipleistophora hominis]|uniref:GOLD domain-containing protein n=1 Tax=Trachipleistophora hominis TaxID=72359 RepID=L7JWM7_TRAHO|nr:hypothetical protein THOM_1362 [Trachipleistophora hominis]
MLSLLLLQVLRCSVEIRQIDKDEAILYINKRIEIQQVYLVYNVVKRMTNAIERYELVDDVQRDPNDPQEIFEVSLPRTKPTNYYYGFEVVDVDGNSFYTERYYFGNDRVFYSSKAQVQAEEAADIEEIEEDEYKGKRDKWSVWMIIGIGLLLIFAFATAIVAIIFVYKRIVTSKDKLSGQTTK